MTNTLDASVLDAGIGQSARTGPVLFTEDGEPAYVLLSIEHYQALVVGSSPSGRDHDREDRRTLAEVFSDPPTADVEFNPPRWGFTSQPAEF